MASSNLPNGTDEQNASLSTSASSSRNAHPESCTTSDDATMVPASLDTPNTNMVREPSTPKCEEEPNSSCSNIPEESTAHDPVPQVVQSAIPEPTERTSLVISNTASGCSTNTLTCGADTSIAPTVDSKSNEPRRVVLTKKLFRTPKERAAQAAENERRLAEAGDLFRRSLIIKSPTTVTPQSSTPARPAEPHDDGDVEIVETGHHFSPIELDTEAEDASAVARFKSYKKSYERKRKNGQNSVEDDIAFSKARNAEEHRLKLKSRKRAYENIDSGVDDDDALFLSERTLSTPMNNSIQEEGSDTPAAPKRRRGRPNKIPESALQDATRIGYAALEAEGRKDASRKRQPKGTGKNKTPKSPKSRVSKAKDKKTPEGGPKPKRGRKRKGPEMLNMETLFNNDIVSAAQANVGKAAQPGFTSTNKKTALAELIASIPESERTTHNADKNALDKATRSFTGHAAMKADGNNGWRLRGMATSLYHYQLLGAAFMRDRENSSTRPYGGLQSDDMGLGKTVTCLANIVDGQAPPKSPNRTTLIVCPAGLCSQWLSEIKKHVMPGTFQETIIYRAGSRLESADPIKTLSNTDIVITSYGEVLRSYPHCKTPMHLVTPQAKENWWSQYFEANRGVLHKIFFRRIVLDEGLFDVSPLGECSRLLTFD